MILYDFFIAAASFFLALWLRFDCQYSSIPDDLLISYLYFIPIYSVLTLLVFAVLRLYNSIWRFANYSELTRVIVATGILCFRTFSLPCCAEYLFHPLVSGGCRYFIMP